MKFVVIAGLHIGVKLYQRMNVLTGAKNVTRKVEEIIRGINLNYRIFMKSRADGNHNLRTPRHRQDNHTH